MFDKLFLLKFGFFFLGVISGFIVMGVAFIVAQSSGVIDASQLMTSATSGPLLGVFVLAMFFPSTNWKVSTSNNFTV